jgi:hypothetical protein
MLSLTFALPLLLAGQPDSVPGSDTPVPRGEVESEDAGQVNVDSEAASVSKPKFNCVKFASWAEVFSKAEKAHTKKSGGAGWWEHTNISVIDQETKQFVLSAAEACHGVLYEVRRQARDRQSSAGAKLPLCFGCAVSLCFRCRDCTMLQGGG